MSDSASYYLPIARRARAAYGFHEFDPWEIVSFLWLRYRDTRHSYSYLSLAVREYCNSERSKRRRALSGHPYRTDITEAPRVSTGGPSVSSVVYPIAKRPPSYEDLGRLLAMGHRPKHIRASLGISKVRMDAMIRTLREHNTQAIAA